MTTRRVAWTRLGRRALLAAGAALVLSGIPSSSSAQDAPGSAGSALVGYDATASGQAFTAFPRLPALLPVEAPVEATVALATATLSSGGQGFARASTFYPGSLTAGLRPLLETGAGAQLPIPDYPIVVEAREFEEAKHADLPGLTMAVDADPDKAVAASDAGALSVPAILTVRSMHTESRTTLGSTTITATSTTTLEGLDVAGLVTIGSLVSTASVTSDGTTATCAGGVRVGDVSIAGTRATIDDDGIHLATTALPGPGIGAVVESALSASGITVKVLGGTSACQGSLGSRTTSGLLVSIPTPAIGPVSPGGLVAVLGSTSATAGGSSLPPDVVSDTGGSTEGSSLGSDLGSDAGFGGTDSDVDLPSSPTGPSVVGSRTATPLPAVPVSTYAFDGVPGSMLAGFLLLALLVAGRVRRYLVRIIGLVDL